MSFSDSKRCPVLRLREDLLKPDLLSEVLLLVSGVVLFIPLLLVVVAAFVETAAKP
jgi:hypothetical protein